MLGPKTDNSVTDSQDVNQVGHNSGTMNIGLTFEQHERNVRELLAKSEALYERLLEAKDRTSRAELAEALAQRDAALEILANLQENYEKTLADLSDLKAILLRYDNVLDRTKHAAADAALDRGDRTLARALLTELSAKARARREDNTKEEAELEFKLGEIAATEMRWHDAAAHFAVAVKLNPTFDTLLRAHETAWLAADYPAALRFAEGLVNWANTQGTREQIATALLNQAWTIFFQDRDEDADGLLRPKIDISEATFAATLPCYTQRLGRIAVVMHRQGRYADTEVLCRQVLAIAAATIGTANGIYCMRIYQLANVIRTNLRFSEAVELYRQALDISGQRNRNIQEGNRLSGHGYWFNYDMLNYDAQIARALLTLLQTHFPDDPEIPALQALLAPTP